MQVLVPATGASNPSPYAISAQNGPRAAVSETSSFATP